MTIDFPPMPEALERKLPSHRRRGRRSLWELKVRNVMRSPAAQFSITRHVTTVRFPISNTSNLGRITFYDVASLYPGRKSIHIEFSREETSKSTPAKRWMVVTIPRPSNRFHLPRQRGGCNA